MISKHNIIQIEEKVNALCSQTLPASEGEETGSEKSQVHALLISGGLLRGEDLRDKRNGKVGGMSESILTEHPDVRDAH